MKNTPKVPVDICDGAQLILPMKVKANAPKFTFTVMIAEGVQDRPLLVIVIVIVIVIVLVIVVVVVVVAVIVIVIVIVTVTAIVIVIITTLHMLIH